MRAGWARLPLRTQLTALFAALLVVALLLTGLTAVTLLRRSLVDQLDDQLASAAPRALAAATRGMPETLDPSGPSDYHVQFATTSGEPVALWRAGTPGVGAPDLPPLDAAAVTDLEGRGFTVAAADGGGRWRVLARPVAADGAVVGSVAVALPMTAADATTRRMTAVVVSLGLAVVALGALGGWWGVRRALDPLRQIEGTAAAIADGDLTRRVPDAPPSTEVGRLAAALNGMLAQLERAFAARGASEERMRRFVADASHELRTPLAAIRGYGELYRMGALTSPEELRRTMARVEDSATRLGVLVEDLLRLARLDEGREPRREPVDLAVVGGDAVADLRALDPGRTVRLLPLTDDGTTAGAVALSDEVLVRQVVANLVGNAARHTPAGTPVELAVGRQGDLAVLEVRDHGPGIPAEHADRVFERFYRVDAGRGRDSGGSGLGLAIVAASVAALGGQVALATTAGGGATVRVTVPAAPETSSG